MRNLCSISMSTGKDIDLCRQLRQAVLQLGPVSRRSRLRLHRRLGASGGCHVTSNLAPHLRHLHAQCCLGSSQHYAICRILHGVEVWDT